MALSPHTQKVSEDQRITRAVLRARGEASGPILSTMDKLRLARAGLILLTVLRHVLENQKMSDLIKNHSNTILSIGSVLSVLGAIAAYVGGGHTDVAGILAILAGGLHVGSAAVSATNAQTK